MKNTTKHITFALILGFITLFTACKKDAPIIDLTLEASTLELYVGDQNRTIAITSGNGDYSVSSSAEAIAKPTVSGNTVSIEGVSKGTATITVKDGSGRTATIAVTVNNAIVDATTARFKWDNTHLLDAVGGYSTTVLANAVAVSSLTEKKQFVVSWTGGYTVGDKTAAKLRILERGKEPQEVTLTVLEVQKAENNMYSIAFGTADKTGELVFTK